MVFLKQLAGILCCRLLLNDLRVDFILEGFGNGLCARSGLYFSDNLTMR